MTASNASFGPALHNYLKYYYATLLGVDDSLGRIFAYLRTNHLEKDTLVVFTSDNDFQIGDHGLIDKRTAYQPSVRVPMLMWEPGTVAAGATNPGRLRNLDCAPTFLDVAGVARPPQFEGQSAWPLISGAVKPADWKPGDFVYEYYWEWSFPRTPGTFAIQRGNLKYIQYYGMYDRDELYDLAADADEMHNLADDPALLGDKITLRRTMFDHLANSQGRHSIPNTQRLSIGSLRRSTAGTGSAPYPESRLVAPNRNDRFDDIIPDSPPNRERTTPVSHWFRHRR